MALINCPDCGTAVSSHAHACPNCGRPFTPQLVRDATQPAGYSDGETHAPPQSPWTNAAEWARPSIALHPMGEVKLLVMSVATLGFYPLYWFYRNWRLRNDLRGANVWPVVRAVFSPLFSYFLFEAVEREAEALNLPVAWSPLVLAVGYFILNLAWQIPGSWSLISLATCVPLIQVQRTINEANARSTNPVPVDTRFSALNIAGIVLGLLMAAILVTSPPA